MSLTNIEYGSLASSETVNNNFLYLDNRISDSNETIMTSISSILSNIATINARLNELSENVGDSVDELDSKLETYKTKLKLLISKTNSVPSWLGCTSINLSQGVTYTVPSNGYILVNPSAQTNVSINGVVCAVKSAQVAVLPVKEADSVVLNVTPASAYFLPRAEISIDNF